ncbi:glycosyl transferase [Hypericibacter adhaerens]|uniref:Glycosyl transferase n=1 Tax=Hypericibacter adhaerens TaxID=2602016 RepID=A0A5J6N0L5_9PROT|nr:glycosyltransferase family 2 protein [Hypericibacter adhaerens]QEX20426.1 glycosyl transferase [Hypericibacter adhaerens]
MTQVSIVICTFNRPLLLAQAVRSCAVQEGLPHGAIGIFVVDNSPDGNAAAQVRELAANSPVPITYVGERRSNIARARNAGIAASDAPFIAFLDDDEEASPRWIAGLLATMERTDADVVFAPVRPRFETGRAPAWDPDARLFTRDMGLPDGTPAPLLATGASRGGGTGNCMLRRATCIGSAEPFDPDFGVTGGEDTDFFMGLSRAGRRFVWCASAPVSEYVPAERSRLDYMARRTFRQNQSYVRLRMKNSERPALMTANLMARGAVQLGLWSLLALVDRVARRSDGSRAWLKMNAGAGKLLWARSGGKHS